MNPLPKYEIIFRDVYPGMSPVPYYPGWAVALRTHKNYYHDSGYIFKEKVQAEVWAETRVLPADYWEINWNLFPGPGSYIHHEATK